MNLKKYKISEISKSMFYGSMPKDDDISEDGKYPIFSGYRFVGYSNKKNIDEPTLIVVARGVGGTGDVKIAPANSFLTNLSIAVDIDENIADKKFLYYFLNVQGLRYLDTGAAQSQITINNLKRHSMLLPDLSSQKRIADILSTYDELIENNIKRIKLLEQMAENLYKEWFVRFRFPNHENTEFENGIPKGWEMRPLSDVAEVIMGQSPSSDKYNDNKEGLPFHQGVGSYGDFYLKDDIYSTEGKKIAEPNSIIFSVRAPVGRINITLNKVILGRGVASINSKYFYNGFLLWQLKNCFSKEDIIGNGAIFTSVTKDELLKYKLILPTDELMKRFNEFANEIELQLRTLYLSNENLIKQRDLLLPRLMSGKLEV